MFSLLLSSTGARAIGAFASTLRVLLRVRKFLEINVLLNLTGFFVFVFVFLKNDNFKDITVHIVSLCVSLSRRKLCGRGLAVLPAKESIWSAAA